MHLPRAAPNSGRAPRRGGMVEHAVDVGVAVLGTEALGGVDRLVDHHPVRHVDAMPQFVGGDAQRRAFDLVDLLDFAVDELGESAVEFRACG